MLQFIDPVLRVSHQEAAPQSVAQLVKSAVGEQQRQLSKVATADPDLQAQQELFNHHVNSKTLQRFSEIGATMTIDLIHAMSGRRH